MKLKSFLPLLAVIAILLGGMITPNQAQSFSVSINFQDEDTTPPAGYLKDFGEPFGQRNGADQGDGVYTYGWISVVGGVPEDLVGQGRNRASAQPDLRLDTVIHMNHPSTPPSGYWEIAVPNGTYDVTVAVGDPNQGSDPEIHRINVEGLNIVDDFVPSGAVGSNTRHTTGSGQVTVVDGKLTVDYAGGDGINTKLNYITITEADVIDPTPYILGTDPNDGATNVPVNAGVVTTGIVTFNPDDQNRTGVNNDTITTSTVYLYPTSAGAGSPVPAGVNGTGGGDSISLTPSQNLQPFTNYTFVIDGVEDLGGFTFERYEMSFTTGADDTGGPTEVDFEKASSGATPGGYGSVQVYGSRLYAVTISGQGMFYWDINADGTLTNETSVNPGNVFNGRAMVGLAIDPRSTESNPIIWVTSNAGDLGDSPNFTGKIYKVEGSSVGTGSENWQATEMVDRLPRSKKDHLSNSLAFGPDGGLYLIQGSITAMGAPDNAWGQRNETLLSAALLRVDIGLLESYVSSNGVLDVYTGPYGFGNPNLPYDPQAAGAPLTVYATGIRNAYDVVWHSNGNAYIPTNGSASGGNSPAYPVTTNNGIGASINTGDTSYDSADEPPTAADVAEACQNRIDGFNYTAPTVPQVQNHPTQRDYLFRVPLGGGGYYGHPNPTRCEWVLNGGNVDASIDETEAMDGSKYPIGTQPDPNYQGIAYDFENNKSPNGVIEYQSNVFNGALQGKLLVVRYSNGDDILILTPGVDGDIVDSVDGSDIFGSFNNPLDLTEDTRNGNIYLIEYPGMINLLRPVGSQVTPEPEIAVDTSDRIFEQITSQGASDAQVVTINNTGTAPLNVNLALSGANSGEFGLSITSFTIPAGNSNSVNITFDPSTNGPKFASLEITSDDDDEGLLTVALNGLGKAGTGGSNEPSLQWVLDTFGLGVDVGDTNDATNTINLPGGVDYNDLLGDEVEAQLFQRAVDAPVTVEVLSVYGPTNQNPVTAFGWYPAANPGSLTEIFQVTNDPSSNGQRLLPPIVGTTSFDPGTQPFGIFSRWPAFSNRLVFQQDALNTFGSAIPSHVRVYAHPTEANAYIVATEEHISGFDYQDIVVILRNVQPVVGASGIVRLENRDWLWPNNSDDAARDHFDNYLAFSNITSTSSNPRVHDQVTLRIHNDSTTEPLTVTAFNLLNNTNNRASDPAYEVVGMLDGGNIVPVSLPLVIPASGSEDVVVEFIYAPNNNGNNEIVEASLDVVTSGGTVTVGLGGAWQRQSESGAEPNVAQIIDAYGFTTTILGPGDALNNEGRIETIGEEILSPFWQRADTSRPVYVRQLAAYHSCCSNTATVFYQPNITTGGTTSIFTHNGVDAQSFLPLINGSSGNPAQGTFNPPNQFFGFKIDPEWSDPNRNNKGPDDCSGGPDTCGHHVRFWPARDYNGEIIPNAFFMVMDYAGINYDFNDNVYFISNIQPQNAQSDVTVSIEAWANNLTVNEAFTYDISISNNSIVQAQDVVVEQTIPAGFTVDSASFGGELCTVANNTLTCDIGDLNPDVAQVIEVTVTPTQQGEVSATATISTSTAESDTDNNSDTETTLVVDPNNIPGTVTIVLDDTSDSNSNFSYNFASQPFTLSDDGTTQTGTPIEINFQVDTTPIDGFTPDIGLPYGDRGNGFTYGWLELGPVNDPYTGIGADSSGAGNDGGSRDRGAGTLESTLNHMQRNDCCDTGFLTPQYWEIEVPNGTYEVTVSVGDPDNEGASGAQHIVNAEGVQVVDSGPIADGETAAAQGTATVTVTDGRLTLDPLDGFNTKIKWVTITPILPTNNVQVFENVLPGTYTVAQQLLSGFDLTGLTCEDPSDNTNLNLSTLSADIVLDSGESIVCTFVNEPVQIAGTITIVQQASPESEQPFSFSGGLGLFSLVDDGSASNTRTFSLPAGSYAITQNALQNWTLDNIVCDSGTVNLGLRTATVELVSGDITCTFSNTKLNTPPVIAAIPQQNVTAGQTVNIAISAPDDDPADTVSIALSLTDEQGATVPPSAYNFTDNGDSTASFSWDTDSNDVGVYYGMVTASDGQGNDMETFIIVVSPEPVLTDAICYNSGYGGTTEFTASDGRIFLPDQYSSGGRPFPNDGLPKSGEAIAGTTDDFIYQTEYSSGVNLEGFSYAIPVENGTYTVDLYFAEIYFGANSSPSGPGGAGQRVFGYNIEGGQINITGYDINDAVGASTADIKSYPGIVISDGTLNIDFSATTNQPKISALCIVPEAEPGNTPPVIAPISPVSLPAGTTLEVPFSASDIDGDNLTLMATVVDGTDTPLNSSSYSDNGNGTGVLTLNPAIGTEGVYTATLMANDGQATSVYSFSVTVTESTVTVNGSLTLQGHSNQSGDVRVRIYEAGTSNLLQESTASVDAAGNFSLTGLDAGTVDIAVKADNSLQVMQTVTLVPGANSVNMGQLPMGDANNDNLIDGLDFSFLRAQFGSAGPEADFSGDGTVDALDFSILRANFNRVGEAPE